MGKSVYSIVLSDEIIREVDNLSYQLGISRSALINRILAEKLELQTEENKVQTIFDYIEESLSGAFKIINQASNSMFSAASPVAFKYRPVAKYMVELSSVGGKIRVEFRTSSVEFINYLHIYYEFFARLEEKYLKNVKIQYSGGRFLREFKTADGEKISGYIKLFDESLKLFFANINNITEVMQIIENKYRQYILSGSNLL